MDLTEEINLFNEGYKIIAGIDEAGRGPLAGPVVSACVALNASSLEKIKADPILLRRVNDSKKLNGEQREILYEVILEELDEIGIGISDHLTVDRINIFQASFLSMKKAISSLKNKPEFLLVDGKFEIPNISIKQKVVVGGDAKLFLVAAASIIAKVTRDRIMLSLDAEYPEYQFRKHKGYGTKLHLKKLEELGPCPIHRMSYGPVRRSLKSEV